MRIFITGAAGFIGSRLSRALLDRSDEVIGFDNMDPYYALEHKERHLRDLRLDSRFIFEEGDLRNAILLRTLIAQHKPDAIVHLGGMAAVRYSVKNPLLYGDVNVQGSVNLFDAARHIGKPRLVIASTGSVYGSSTPVPFVETASADCPLAPYPASKRAMELFAHTYQHLWGLPTTVVRFFNVYGPHGRPDMMPWQWTMDILAGNPLTLYNAGHLKRDWTYIDDIVSGLQLAIDKPQEKFEIINLGCAQPVENLQFVQILEKLLGEKTRIQETPCPASEPLITYADISKAQRLLGYQPKFSVEQGLTQFIAWMQQEKII